MALHLTFATKDAVRQTRHLCFHQSQAIIPRFALCLSLLINNLWEIITLFGRGALTPTCGELLWRGLPN